MSVKRGFAICGIVIILCYLANIGINFYDEFNQKRLAKEYELRYEKEQEMIMRFDINIEAGEYDFLKDNLSYIYYVEGGFDNAFNAVCDQISIERDINTKYSEYVLTQDASYIYVDINNEFYSIKYPLPLSSSQLMNLSNILGENEKMEVFPFNDGIHCLISLDGENHIINIENGQILWTRGGYYESPRVNIFSDTLECGGDLSANTYIFNKYGELIKTVKPKADYIGLGKSILNIFSSIIVILIIKNIIKFNVRNNIAKTVGNIILNTAIILVVILLLMIIGVNLLI